jgi:hypothetical protein
MQYWPAHGAPTLRTLIRKASSPRCQPGCWIASGCSSGSGRNCMTLVAKFPSVSDACNLDTSSTCTCICTLTLPHGLFVYTAPTTMTPRSARFGNYPPLEVRKLSLGSWRYRQILCDTEGEGVGGKEKAEAMPVPNAERPSIFYPGWKQADPASTGANAIPPLIENAYICMAP